MGLKAIVCLPVMHFCLDHLSNQSPDTWRYRIWQWLRSNNIEFEFVGPYQGTHKPTPPSSPQSPLPEGQTEFTVFEKQLDLPQSQGSYAPNVDSDFIPTSHFTHWGYQTHQAKSAIASQISTYQPDYLLIVLGFNDLGWFVNGPDGLLSDMKALVDNAREVKSDIKFAIADVPQRKRLEGRQDLIEGTEEYNQKLAEAIKEWSREESPVRLVGLCEGYGCKLRAFLFHFIFLLRRSVDSRK
jgi:hypothetical protein